MANGNIRYMLKNLSKRHRISITDERGKEVWYSFATVLKVALNALAAVVVVFIVSLFVAAYTKVLDIMPGYDGITSREMELKLTNVAKSSMHELRLDYEDYLLTRRLTRWTVDDPRTQQTRSYTRTHMLPEQYQHMVDTRSAETAANIAITMLHQFDVLITRLIEAQKRRFLEEGGIKEQMYRARIQARETRK